MTSEQEKKLARIKNYHTRYEAVVTDGTTTYLLAYICGKSFRHLLEATQNRVEAINAVTLSQAWVENGKLSAGKFEIKWSGRTQREAILNGEFQSVRTLAESMKANVA